MICLFVSDADCEFFTVLQLICMLGEGIMFDNVGFILCLKITLGVFVVCVFDGLWVCTWNVVGCSLFSFWLLYWLKLIWVVGWVVGLRFVCRLGCYL